MNLSEMTLAQLAERYNALVAETGGKPVKEFRSKADGIRRISDLETDEKPFQELPEDPEEAKRQLQEEFGDQQPPPPPEDQGFGDQQPFDEAPEQAQWEPEPAPEKPAKVRQPKAAKVRPEVDINDVDSLRAGFGLRAGTHRERAVNYLLDHIDEQVPGADLVKAVYGEDGALPHVEMVLKGARMMIENNQLPVELVKAKDENKRSTFGIIRKG